MQKLQNNWPLLRAHLNKKLADYKGDIKALSNATGVDYFAVRRALHSGVKNYNSNAERLCLHFQLAVHKTAKSQVPSIEMLSDVLTNVWDGSESHAQLLVALIESTRSFKVSERKKT